VDFIPLAGCFLFLVDFIPLAGCFLWSLSRLRGVSCFEKTENCMLFLKLKVEVLAISVFSVFRVLFGDLLLPLGGCGSGA